MNPKMIVSSLVAASLGLSSLAWAQPRNDRHDRNDSRQEIRRDAREARQDIREGRRDLRDARQDRRELRDDRRDAREARRYYNARGAEFRRGHRLPPELRHRHYVVSDWRGHRLSAPPRGYHWVQVGPDYVLAAVATGVIMNMILNP